MRNNFKNLHPTEIKNSINFQIYCYIQNRYEKYRGCQISRERQNKQKTMIIKLKFDLNPHNFLDQFSNMSGLKPHHTKASSFNSYESELISSTHYVVKLDLHIFNSGTKGTEQ